MQFLAEKLPAYLCRDCVDSYKFCSNGDLMLRVPLCIFAKDFRLTILQIAISRRRADVQNLKHQTLTKWFDSFIKIELGSFNNPNI